MELNILTRICCGLLILNSIFLVRTETTIEKQIKRRRGANNDNLKVTIIKLGHGRIKLRIDSSYYKESMTECEIDCGCEEDSPGCGSRYANIIDAKTAIITYNNLTPGLHHDFSPYVVIGGSNYVGQGIYPQIPDLSGASGIITQGDSKLTYKMTYTDDLNVPKFCNAVWISSKEQGIEKDLKCSKDKSPIANKDSRQENDIDNDEKGCDCVEGEINFNTKDLSGGGKIEFRDFGEYKIADLIIEPQANSKGPDDAQGSGNVSGPSDVSDTGDVEGSGDVPGSGNAKGSGDAPGSGDAKGSDGDQSHDSTPGPDSKSKKPTESNKPDDKQKISPGAIAGIVFATFAVIIITIVGIIFAYKRFYRE